MNISMVLEATENTQGVSGPSEINAVMQMARDVSRDFGDASNNLRNAIASLIKKIRFEEIDDSSLSPLKHQYWYNSIKIPTFPQLESEKFYGKWWEK